MAVLGQRLPFADPQIRQFGIPAGDNTSDGERRLVGHVTIASAAAHDPPGMLH